jgi:anti-sigma factor RsiW
MNCQRVRESFLDYEDGRLSPAETDAVRDHLATCLECQREFAGLQEISLKLDLLPPVEPSPRLRSQFYAMLDAHRRAADAPSPFVLMRSRLDRIFSALMPARPALQFALVCFMLAAGLFLGARFSRESADPTTANTIARLQNKVDSMVPLLTYSVLQQQSTTERLKTVLSTLDLKQSDQQIVNGLLTALAFDPSVNVRLSALEALYPHADQPAVRSAVTASLPREPSPLVQVTMIDFLAASRDPSAFSTIESVSRSETYDQAVREAARRALAQL